MGQGGGNDLVAGLGDASLDEIDAGLQQQLSGPLPALPAARLDPIVHSHLLVWGKS